MAQLLRAHPVLLRLPDFVPSTHIGLFKTASSSSYLCLLLDSVGTHAYLAYIHEHKLRHINEKKSCEMCAIFTY